MATTQFNNRLITPELTEALSSYPLDPSPNPQSDCRLPQQAFHECSPCS